MGGSAEGVGRPSLVKYMSRSPSPSPEPQSPTEAEQSEDVFETPEAVIPMEMPSAGPESPVGASPKKGKHAPMHMPFTIVLLSQGESPSCDE